MWAVRAPSKELAQKFHAAILACPDLRATAKRLNPELDVSPMDNPRSRGAAASVSTAAAAERGSATRRRPRRPTRRRCRGEEGPRRGWRGWASSGRA